MTREEEKELLKLTKENNLLLKDIHVILCSQTENAAVINNIATNFGVGIVSNLVGDRIFKSLGWK